MLTIYVKTGCPYCAKVIEVVDEFGIEVTYKNKNEEGVVDELVARGGKSQYPYLVDEGRGEEMYESDDIAAYLKEHYSA